MELKVLTLRDKEAIKALFTEIFTKEPWCDDWSDEAQLDAYITDLTGQSYSLTFGYFDSDRMVGLSMGYIKHWYTGTEYCIDEFCIARDLQGKGLGGAFLKEIEAYLLARGIVQIFLLTDRAAPAFEFYRKNGFEELPGIVAFAKEFEVVKS